MRPSNSDRRRDIYEFERFPVCKVVRTKEECILGRHYHKLKEEVFVLVAGQGLAYVAGKTFTLWPFEAYVVRPLEMHSFKLSAGSVLLGFCTTPYDPSDDYPVSDASAGGLETDVSAKSVPLVPGAPFPYSSHQVGQCPTCATPAPVQPAKPATCQPSAADGLHEDPGCD